MNLLLLAFRRWNRRGGKALGAFSQMRRGEKEELWMRRRTANWISWVEEERIFWHWHHGADDPPSLLPLCSVGNVRDRPRDPPQEKKSTKRKSVLTRSTRLNLGGEKTENIKRTLVWKEK